MKDIKEHIEERLWNFIKRNYNSENFTNAILDSIQFLGDIIREKSGLDSDGNSLIGTAFGGKNPKIKLNKLKTESEKNIQKGIESILRGIYSAYRNPRSHSKIQDTEQEAFEIIIYINHLLKLIDKSKGKFSIELFLKRVFDEEFVPTQKYATLLVKEIPTRKIFEVAIEVFKQKESGNIHNLTYVWNSLINKLNLEEKKEIIDLISEELRYTDSLKTVIRCIALFKSEWDKIDEDARLRAENMIIQIIPYAEKDSIGVTNEYGIFASWFTSLVKKTLLPAELSQKIYDSLASQDLDKQRFIISYFGSYLDYLQKDLSIESYNEIFKKELKNGNVVIYEFITNNYGEKKQIEFKEDIENFVSIENKDDLPF